LKFYHLDLLYPGTHIAASSTVVDDKMNFVTHRVLNTNL